MKPGPDIVDSKSLRAIRKISPFLLVAVALLPPLRIGAVLLGNGGNTESNDSVPFVLAFLGKVLDGTYDWSHFSRDTFQHTHSNIVPGLAYVLQARVAHLNVYVSIGLGLIFAGIKLILLFDAFTFRFREKNRLIPWLLLPILSAPIFSFSEINVFEHGLQPLKTGLQNSVLRWDCGQYLTNNNRS